MIIVEITEGIIERRTTAGKENTGTVSFMGGQLYIPNLDNKYKNGMHTNIRLEASYSGQYGINATSVLEAKPKS